MKFSFRNKKYNVNWFPSVIVFTGLLIWIYIYVGGVISKHKYTNEIKQEITEFGKNPNSVVEEAKNIYFYEPFNTLTNERDTALNRIKELEAEIGKSNNLLIDARGIIY